jgi:cellulose synthase/poly-beta-1,6-N-acetylglucosamine synthase-like glycosyltransferase
MHNLGLPCQLMGTGMAFPRALIENTKLGTAHIVEDMKLGIDLACQGHAPLFCPDALVESYFPAGEEAIGSQRARWEHGHLTMIFSEATNLIITAIFRFDMRLLAMAFDLLVPPLSFLVMLLTLMVCMTAVCTALLGFGAAAFAVSGGAVVLLFCAISLAWYYCGRDIVSTGELLWIPVYVLTKVPMYLRYWTKRQTDWIRTNRD